MMITAEEQILKAREIFDGLVEYVRQARTQQKLAHETEQHLFDVSREAMRLLLSAYFANKGDGDCGEEIRTKHAQVLPRFGHHTRPYRSVFGDVTLERVCYGRGKIEAAPLDAELGLPEHCYSYLLQQWTQDLIVDVPFQQSVHKIEEILRIPQPVRSAERINRHVAGSVAAFREQAPPPACASEAHLLVGMADATSLPLCLDRAAGEQPSRAPGRRRQRGKNAQKRKQAVCSTVYTIAPFPRAPDDVLDDIRRRHKRQERPRPQNKRVRGDLLGGKVAAFEWMADEVRHRQIMDEGGVPLARSVILIFDGDPKLWDYARTYLGLDSDARVVGILDLYHVLERLYAVAYLFHPEGSEEAHTFVEARLQMLLKGRVGRMIGGLRQMATKRGWALARRKRGRPKKGQMAVAREPKKVKVLRLAIEYFETNRRYLRYDHYLRAGYPIGSGPAEGTCRHLVKDRMDNTGMRWTETGAQAMLDLRAIHISDQWSAFWPYHIQHETARLYGHLDPTTLHFRQAA